VRGGSKKTTYASLANGAAFLAVVQIALSFGHGFISQIVISGDFKLLWFIFCGLGVFGLGHHQITITHTLAIARKTDESGLPVTLG
jgi:hypothetical protein